MRLPYARHYRQRSRRKSPRHKIPKIRLYTSSIDVVGYYIVASKHALYRLCNGDAKHRQVALLRHSFLKFHQPTFFALGLLLIPFIHHGLRSNSHRAGQYRRHQVRLTRFSGWTELTFRYWGKRDTKLILPTNSSLSVTLDQDHLRSTTTSRADESFESGDKLWLNGKDDPIKEGGRLWVCIKELRAWRKEMEDKDSSLPKVTLTSVNFSTRRR